MNFLLGGVRLPEIYDSLFSQHQRSGRVSYTTLSSILTKGRISANQIEKVSQSFPSSLSSFYMYFKT